MAHPFVFHFRPDPHGHPEVMTITDLQCGCGVCGHPQIQRFYHATPFHPLTLTGLLRLASEAPHKVGYTCENCGSEVASITDVGAAVLRLALADDAGEIICFVSDVGSVDGPTVRAQVRPNRRLDPQVQPTFEPDDALETYALLTEGILMQRLERPLSIKAAWRDLASDWLADPQGGASLRVAPGMWLFFDENEALLKDLVEEVQDDDLRRYRADNEVVWIPLMESVPDGLPTHTRPDEILGRWPEWMLPEVTAALERGDAVAGAYVHMEQAMEVVTRAFDVARLEWSIEGEGAARRYTEIATPRGYEVEHDLTLRAVLRRAVHTGISPGEAARLTAEELVGLLLNVWNGT